MYSYSFHGATCTTGSTAAAGDNGMDADEPNESDMEMDVQDLNHSGTFMGHGIVNSKQQTVCIN